MVSIWEASKVLYKQSWIIHVTCMYMLRKNGRRSLSELYFEDIGNIDLREGCVSGVKEICETEFT